MMGKVRGRICLLYQINFEEDVLVYKASLPDRRLSGEVTSQDGFVEAVSELMDAYATDRIEPILKLFSIPGSINGICPKSFPRSELTSQLLSLINLCVGGESGVQLVQMPYAGALTDQPNLFMQAYSVFVEEHHLWMSRKRREAERGNNKR
jgi:hypothetical protein